MRWLKTVAILLTVVVVAVGGRWLLLSSHDDAGVTAAPAIGGPFELVNGQGQTVTEADFRGRYMLVYFGYTYCPDVCPTTLATMGQALDMLPPETAEKITPVFITVDPERDTPELVGEYVKHFHPRLVGLTGTAEQIRTVTQAYRVYYQKVEEEGDDPDAYLMDHSAIAYLMGPDGAFLTHFSHGIAPEKMAETLAEQVS